MDDDDDDNNNDVNNYHTINMVSLILKILILISVLVANITSICLMVNRIV